MDLSKAFGTLNHDLLIANLYNLRTQTDFLRSSTSTRQYGLNSLSFLDSKVWAWFHWKVNIKIMSKVSKKQ